MLTRTLTIAVCALLGACASGAAPSQRGNLARQIADDAAAFNDAYAQAVQAQILLNIMRSRDRLPRHYLSMTGIADSPSWRYRQNAGIGSIPLGDGGAPWGIGSVGLERETQTRPTYAVQPFGAETLTRTAFDSTQPYVFAHYWRSGWPRDLLTLLLVERITLVRADGHTRFFYNEANEIFGDCADDVQTEGCAFVRTLRGFLSRVGPHSQISTDPSARAVCGLVDAYAPERPVRAAPPSDNERCDPTFVVGGDTYVFRLRSLDDTVYYVGELLRAGSMIAAHGEAIEAQITVNAAGLRGGGQGVPLFRVVPQESSLHGRIYGAEVAYGGERLYAGPAVSRSCAEAASEGLCQDNAEQGDRSSSVLSLIAELLALNQSPDAIRAPNRLIAE
jgi:hypothetical protein